MYNVNVLTECQDEEEFAVVLSAVLAMLEEESTSNLMVRKPKRTSIISPDWNAITREEY